MQGALVFYQLTIFEMSIIVVQIEDVSMSMLSATEGCIELFQSSMMGKDDN